MSLGIVQTRARHASASKFITSLEMALGTYTLMSLGRFFLRTTLPLNVLAGFCREPLITLPTFDCCGASGTSSGPTLDNDIEPS